MNVQDFNKPVRLQDVQITDSFWGREQELVRKEVIPYQWDALNDRIPDAAPSFCMRNFKTAGKMMKEKKQKKDFVAPTYSFRGFNKLPDPEKGLEEDTFYGFVFQDSDFAKWIEAVGYSLTNHPDQELEKTADEAIDIVCAAQAENGYLDTYYIINGMDRIFTNLRDHHELYCFGHLVEGAVAYYQATGKDKLLKAAMRYGDFISTCFGPEEGKCKGYPGHEIAEMALARLYELTGEQKYLDLSSFFLNMRGTQPYYFDIEAKERAEHDGTEWKQGTDPNRYAYHQAHLPVREQSEAVGHAVRATYLYSGMADVARLTGDDAMYQACERIWNSIVNEKLYLTGGIGGTHLGEAFSFPYDLPNDRAYSETCAAIGLVFFARRMLEIKADRSYGDVMEQALYNTVLAGMALDGKSFFYVNPLEVVPEACKKDGRKEHVKPVRQKWFGCACCPPNIARTVSSVGAYVYTYKEDTLFTHLYVGSKASVTLSGKTLDMQMESNFPWQGDVKISLHTADTVEGTLAFRMPGWCNGAQVSVCSKSGEKIRISVEKDALRVETDPIQEGLMSCSLQNGYLYLTGDWQDEDSIALDFPMEVHCVSADARVREDMGKVAFTRGPICYCAEEADNGKELHKCSVDIGRMEREGIRMENFDELGQKMCRLRVPGLRIESMNNGVGKGMVTAPGLYHDFTRPEEKEITLTLIPYYAWGNRGEGEMSVWLRYSL